MLKKLKSQKGITLISLIVYVIVMLVVVSIIGTITSYFYSNVNKEYQESKNENNEDILDMYLVNDLKNKQVEIKTAELTYLEKNLYENRYCKYQNKPENLRLFLAQNQYSEIEEVAKNVLKLVRDEGYRYKDI